MQFSSGTRAYSANVPSRQVSRISFLLPAVPPSWMAERNMALGSSRPRMTQSTKTSWLGCRDMASGPGTAMRPMALQPPTRGLGKE